jgi:glycosyl transferase family 25
MTELQEFFTQLNSFFDKIYVITLKRATERHQHVQKELAGLHYHFFYGKDKAEFRVEDLKEKNIYNEELAIKNHRYNKPLPAGMIGCSWSHALIYRDVVENGYEKVLVMEDDMVIDKNNIQLLKSIFAELPNNWELLYFGFAANETPPTTVFFKKAFYHIVRFFGGMKFSHRTINNHYPKKVTQHLYKAGYHDCTHAYGITHSAAKKLLALQTPISFLPDNLLAHAATNEIVTAFITRPKIINQLSQVENGPTHSYINE